MKKFPVKTTLGIIRPQNGAILVISLVLLTVMTLIGVTAMQTTIMQERMAGNSRDLNLAFEAAEAANRVGENWLTGQTAMPNPRGCVAGTWPGVWDDQKIVDVNTQTVIEADALFCASGAGSYLDTALWQDAWYFDDPGLWPSGTAVPLTGVQSPPGVVIEFVEHIKDSQNLGQQQDLSNSRAIYRVTSRGTGGTDTAQAFVQTSFAKRF